MPLQDRTLTLRSAAGFLSGACFAAALALFGAAAGAQGCGGATPCMVSGPGESSRASSVEALGEYRVRQPQNRDPRALAPAILFVHGWRGSANGVIGNKALTRFADEVGAVLIAPEGLGETWSYPGSPARYRDEFAYFDALREDVIARHGVDPDRILVSGFSMGGSMVWNLACRRGDQYWAFAPFSGAFWTPLPERCASPPAALIHTHGEADRTVPIAGRPIGFAFRQGDAEESFEILRDQLALEPAAIPAAEAVDGLRCARWSGPEDQLLEFCRHGGGHFWRVPWLRAAWSKLQASRNNL